MYKLVDRPFENERLKEEIEAINLAQKRAAEMGGYLVTEYATHFLPRLETLEGIKRNFRARKESELIYDWDCELGTLKALPGAPYGVAVLIPFPGAQLPKALQEVKVWTVAEAVLDYSTRTITIQNGDSLITFPCVDVSVAEWQQLQAINEALMAQNAGVLAWKLSGVVSDPDIQHLYPEGKVPMVRNEHAQATVTGYATTTIAYNTVLVYAGVIAFKTAIESLHATLLQKKALSLDGSMANPEGHYHMEAVFMPDFVLYHAALICDAAMPGRWGPQDENAYALVFRQPGREEADVDALLEAAVLVRLREVLPHAVKDEWAHVLFSQACEKGLIERLNTVGDCLAGARIHLDKDWTAVMNDLLAEKTLTV
jgi:hypothetical protein